ncbi:hypothetical protein TRIATDRAFT_85687 [Trichoderma atroviride IMI 206040]|uniref:Uncharacterized protein n=1 Tax=Hypocrea atroviridis (strain ATCC 20476 / IMI 206040) TaxID=452589 RepID=G9P2J0_HYPAI|nr:uncharacterized protein TRIATDRAFT_85687 [Trichoderma atroviride IMI 206040]EHK43508.1 hypothetical protein TRIATDRAFT_85687 [Trichoderma atroviride IMI 206040]
MPTLAWCGSFIDQGLNKSCWDCCDPGTMDGYLCQRLRSEYSSWVPRGYSAVRYHALGLCVPGAFCTASDDEPNGLHAAWQHRKPPNRAWRIGASSRPFAALAAAESFEVFQNIKSHAGTQYTLTASAPGAAGYLRRRYSPVAQPGTPKLGDTCCLSRLRRLNSLSLPRVACIAPPPPLCRMYLPGRVVPAP